MDPTFKRSQGLRQEDSKRSLSPKGSKEENDFTHESEKDFLDQKIKIMSWAEKLPKMAELVIKIKNLFLSEVFSASNEKCIHSFLGNRGSDKIIYHRATQNSGLWIDLVGDSLVPKNFLDQDPSSYVMWSVIYRIKRKSKKTVLYRVNIIMTPPKEREKTMKDPPIEKWSVTYHHFAKSESKFWDK